MLNSKFNVYRNEWLELVFANRNQSYGAFELRKNYERTLAKALLCASVFFVGAICSPLIYSKIVRPTAGPTEVISETLDDERIVYISPIKKDPVKLPETEKPAAMKSAGEPAQLNTKRFVTMQVVSHTSVVDDPPIIDELKGSVISTVDSKGVSAGDNAGPTEGVGGGNGTGISDETGDSDLYTTGGVQRYPEFPGGMDAFSKYLSRNLRYPASAADNGIMGRVFVSFIVEKDGSLTDIKVIKGIGFGCDEEAVRVLKRSPLWLPGMQNERKVRVQYTIPIVFKME